jgi:hypothetical protein
MFSLYGVSQSIHTGSQVRCLLNMWHIPRDTVGTVYESAVLTIVQLRLAALRVAHIIQYNVKANLSKKKKNQ